MKEPLLIVIKDYEQHLPQNKLRHVIGKHLGIEKKLKALVFDDQHEFEKEVTKLCKPTLKEHIKGSTIEKFVFIDLSSEYFIDKQTKADRGIQIQFGVIFHALITNYKQNKINLVLYINNMSTNYFIKEVNKYLETEIWINSNGKFIYLKS